MSRKKGGGVSYEMAEGTEGRAHAIKGILYIYAFISGFLQSLHGCVSKCLLRRFLMGIFVPGALYRDPIAA